MPSRDADARVLEQFLRTMAPPAALTATYRQRVVCASLDARAKVVLVRRAGRCLAAVVLLWCAVLVPSYVLSHLFSRINILPGWRLETVDVRQTVTPVFHSMQAAAEGYELAVLQSRADMWAAAQRTAQP